MMSDKTDYTPDIASLYQELGSVKKCWNLAGR